MSSSGLRGTDGVDDDEHERSRLKITKLSYAYLILHSLSDKNKKNTITKI